MSFAIRKYHENGEACAYLAGEWDAPVTAYWPQSPSSDPFVNDAAIRRSLATVRRVMAIPGDIPEDRWDTIWVTIENLLVVYEQSERRENLLAEWRSSDSMAKAASLFFRECRWWHEHGLPQPRSATANPSWPQYAYSSNVGSNWDGLEDAVEDDANMPLASATNIGDPGMLMQYRRPWASVGEFPGGSFSTPAPPRRRQRRENRQEQQSPESPQPEADDLVQDPSTIPTVSDPPRQRRVRFRNRS